MKQLSTRTISFISLIAITFLALGVFAIQKVYNTPLPIVENEKTETQETQEKNEETITETIDTSNWKTFRNEEYGFEFKLSDEYLIPENLSNQKSEIDGVVLLDPQKTKYVFNSKKGLEVVKEVAGLGDAIDYWAVKITIHTYSSEFETNFSNWIKMNKDVSISKLGEKGILDGTKVKFVTWESISEDSSMFFPHGRYIIELNSPNEDYINKGIANYFSGIINSVRFFR